MTRSIIVTAIVSLLALAAVPTEAVVYCREVGVPKGCVARPGAAGVGVAPGVGAGAAGPGLREGTPANRGGPVNRVGRH